MVTRVSLLIRCTHNMAIALSHATVLTEQRLFECPCLALRHPYFFLSPFFLAREQNSLTKGGLNDQETINKITVDG